MKAGLYIRVSTEEQAREGYSIEAQKNKLTAYCQIHDIDIFGYYIDDGISGKSLERPRVKELIADIKNKKIDTIVVFKLDRLTRSVKDLLMLMDLFDKHKTKFISLSEQIDTSSATGRMFVQLLGVFAEWERSVIGERVVVGMEQRAKTGKYTARRVLGYDYDPETQTYSINEEEAKIVRLVFERHNQGKGYFAIAKELNSLGYRSKDGNMFANNSLVHMVNHGWYYCGKFLYKAKGKEPQLLDASNIPPIISYEEFMKAQSIKNANFSLAKKYGRDEFWLKGRIFCECGTSLKTATSGTKKGGSPYRYYSCKKAVEGRCDCFYSCSMNKMHNMFVEKIKEYANSDYAIDLKANTKLISTYNKQIQQLTLGLEKDYDRKKKLTLLLLDGTISNNDYQDMLSTIVKEIEDKTNNIKQLENRIEEINNTNTNAENKKIIGKLFEKWESLTDVQKKEFIQVFIKRIIVNKSGIISIEFLV